MLLAEAVAEKEYLKKSIKSLVDAMSQTIMSDDKPKNALSKNLKKLDELYKKYQQFEITTNRAMFEVTIQISDMELSLAESSGLKEAMLSKLADYGRLMQYACDSVDIEPVNDRIEEIRRDIKTLDTAINRAMWSTEI
jgi:hypothetical protein